MYLRIVPGDVLSFLPTLMGKGVSFYMFYHSLKITTLFYTQSLESIGTPVNDRGENLGFANSINF